MTRWLIGIDADTFAVRIVRLDSLGALEHITNMLCVQEYMGRRVPINIRRSKLETARLLRGVNAALKK